MDRNTITGLVLIAGILFVFSLFSGPGETTGDKNDDERREEVVADPAVDSVQKSTSGLIPVLGPDSLQLRDSSGAIAFRDTTTGKDTFLLVGPVISDSQNEVSIGVPCKKELIYLENDKLKIAISNQGGDVCGVWLKEYRDYHDWMAKREVPLQLLDNRSEFGVEFFLGDKQKNSSDYCFRIIQSNPQSAKLEMSKDGRKIQFTYTLNDGKYDVDLDIRFSGFSDKEASDMAFTCDLSLLSTEKHLESERNISTLFFKYREDSYDYLSVVGDDEYIPEQKTDWIAYKQSYFSAVLMSEDGLEPMDGGNLEVLDPQEDSSVVKRYRSKMSLGMANMSENVSLKWYFGPNDYDVLAIYDNGAEDVVDLGWGLFRWINVYAMRPMFNFFMSWGWGAGLAILLLTIVVKIILSPVNYKMYISSAKMKVLKPEIDKIAKKYPKKEDAMKKQQDIMALYRETGVNPLAGCIPMLIQMPILFAIFRLFPSSIEIRQQGFLWAEDLSTFDSVYDFGFYVPLYGDHISLFTLLMSITTLAYTHYTSQSMTQPTAEGMPNMKVIMYIFPILMIFFFNNFSSGLSYYYFISTLMTMGIMWGIKRFMVSDAAIEAKIAANRENPTKKKKSRFMQRLEDAQKLQQERMKNKGKS